MNSDGSKICGDVTKKVEMLHHHFFIKSANEALPGLGAFGFSL